MRKILFTILLFLSLTLSAQDVYKNLMINEINNGNFNIALSYLNMTGFEFQGDESELQLNPNQYDSFCRYAFVNNISDKQKIMLYKYMADYIYFLAYYNYEQGINDDAQSLFEASLQYYNAIQEFYPFENAVVNLYLGNVLYRKSNISESAKYYGNTLNIMDAYNLGDSLNYYQTTINNIISLNNDTIILKTLEDAYQIAKQNKSNSTAHQDMLYVISTLNYKRGEYQSSYDYCSELQKISTENSDYNQVAIDGLLLNSMRLNDFKTAQESIERGANVNSLWCAELPLDLAILCDESKYRNYTIEVDITKNPFTELLLKSGAEVDKYFSNLETAVFFEDYSLCNLLLKYGADSKKLVSDSTMNVIQYAENKGLKRFVSLLKNKRNYSNTLTVQELDMLYRKLHKNEEYEKAEKLALQALGQFHDEIDETRYQGFTNREQILYYIVSSIVNQALIYEMEGELENAESCIRRAISYEKERNKYPNKKDLGFGDLDVILIRILSQRNENINKSNVYALNDLDFYKSRGIKDRHYWMSVAETAKYFAEKGMRQDAHTGYKLLLEYCSSVDNPIDSIGLLNYHQMLLVLSFTTENSENITALKEEYKRAKIFFKEVFGTNEIPYYNLLVNINPIFIGKEDYDDILRNYIRVINESNDETLKKNLADLETRVLYNKYNMLSFSSDTTLMKEFLLDAEPFIKNLQRYSSQDYLINDWIYYNYKLSQWEKILEVVPTHLNNIRSEIEKDLSTLSSEMTHYYLNVRNPFFYEDIINIAVNKSNPSQDILKALYDFSLFKKGLLLRNSDALSSFINESQDSSAIILYNKVQELKIEREKIKETSLNDTLITQLSKEIDNKERILHSLSYEYKNSKEHKEITWKGIKDKLKSNEVAIEFVNYGYLDSYFALLVRKDFNFPILVKLPRFVNCPQEYKEFQIGLYKDWSKLPLLEPLESPHFLEFEGSPEKVYEYESNGTELYNILWKPILEHIKPGETIYFAPTGILHQLAIEYLPVDSVHTMSDVYNMVRLSSTREIVTNKSKESYNSAVVYGGISYDLDNKDILVESNRYPDVKHRSLGNDSINRGSAKFLPGTKDEAEKINKLLIDNKIEAKIYKTKSANEESFKSLNGKHNNILHIATHGFTWTDSTARKQDYFADRMKMQLVGDNQMRGPIIDPLDRCGLLFAGANTALQGKSKELPEGVQDGILTAKEISLMDLRDAELVVLSACETAKGDITSEGVFGLQRAFKMAGVKTIIMSLWKVDDRATQLLMTEFYTNWISKKQPKREAFKNAQNIVKKQYSEPSYWAGFVMLD